MTCKTVCSLGMKVELYIKVSVVEVTMPKEKLNKKKFVAEKKHLSRAVLATLTCRNILN